MADINDLISPEALKGLDQMNASLERSVALIDKVAQQASSLDASLSKLSMTTKDTKTAQEGVNNASKEATQINSNLKSSEDSIVEAKLKFARANKQQRDELKSIIVLEDQEAGTLEKLRARNSQLAQMRNKLNLETKEGRKQLKNINSELDANNVKIKSNSDALTKQKINIGNYSSALSGLPGPMGMVMTSIKSFTAVLLANPIAALIFAIVAVIALLIKAFKGTEEGGDRIEKMFRKIKAVIDVLYDRIKNLATGLMKVFSGEAKLRDLKGTFADLGDEIKREVEIAGQLADMMDRLEDREIDMITISADRKASIDKLMESASDANKTDEEQLSLLTQAKRLIDEEAKAQQELQLTRIANELGMTDEAAVRERINQLRREGKQLSLDEIGQAISTNVDRRRVNEEIAKYIGLEEQAATESRRIVTRQTALQVSLKKTRDFEAAANEARKTGIEITKEATTAADDYFNTVNELNSKELKFNEDLAASNENLQRMKIDALNEELEVQKQVSALKMEVVNSAFDLNAALIDRQSAKLEAAYDREVAAAGDDADKKAAIDEKYEKKRIALQRKQAVADKAQSVFSIVLNTAMGIMNAASKVVTLPLIPWIAALGALQTAAVIAAPLPQYAKGTSHSKGGMAVIGERGQELLISPSGNVSLSGDSAHLAMLQAGTKIIPSDETKRIMQAAAMSKRSTVEQTIEKGNRDIVKAIRDKESLIINAATGNSITKRQGNVWKTYFDKHLS